MRKRLPEARFHAKSHPCFALFACLLLFVTVFTGCASVGEPNERKTPTPAAVTDLSAEQSGNNVVLAFTLPTQSADHRALPRPPSVQIYRAIHPELAAGAARPTAPALLVTIPSAMVGSYVT